jgi:hypothetical protein
MLEKSESTASCAASRTRKSGLPDSRTLTADLGKPEIGGRPVLRDGRYVMAAFVDSAWPAPSSGRGGFAVKEATARAAS